MFYEVIFYLIVCINILLLMWNVILILYFFGFVSEVFKLELLML